MDSCPIAEPMVQRIAGAVSGPSDGAVRPRLAICLRSAQPPMTLTTGRFGPPTDKRILLIKWVVSGAAMMNVDGRRIRFGANQVAIHVPSMTHSFWVLEEPSVLCWISLDGPLAESFALGIGLRTGIFDYGPPPVDEITRLSVLLQDQSLTGVRHASQAAVNLLYEIVSHCDISAARPPLAIEQAKRIIEEHFSDPELSAASIARRLDYHRASISRMFHQATGQTLIDHLTEVRLRTALTLLVHTSDKISEVARKCGIRGHVYFCRWIRKHTGYSPQQIRNGMMQDRIESERTPLSVSRATGVT